MEIVILCSITGGNFTGQHFFTSNMMKVYLGLHWSELSPDKRESLAICALLRQFSNNHWEYMIVMISYTPSDIGPCFFDVPQSTQCFKILRCYGLNLIRIRHIIKQ